MTHAYRPSTIATNTGHFRTYIAFNLYMGLSMDFKLPNILVVLEFLAKNGLSSKVIQGYISLLRVDLGRYALEASDLSLYAILTYLRSLSINTPFRPTPCT